MVVQEAGRIRSAPRQVYHQEEKSSWHQSSVAAFLHPDRHRIYPGQPPSQLTRVLLRFNMQQCISVSFWWRAAQ